MDYEAIEPEVKKALDCVKNRDNFILEGGAGSGKTYSLISLIKVIANESPNKKIVCITYTNNAVAEIKSRIEYENLIVSTIHEFMWSLIKKYQNEIKSVLVALINDGDSDYKIFAKPQNFSDNPINIDYFLDVQVDYDEYYSMNISDDKRVRISHDHVLIVAERMFSQYKKLSDIFKDVADCIFIDEYQDTNTLVAKILLEHLKKSNKKNVIGFFGDSMQSIYDDGVGDLDKYDLTKIYKEQNRRNPTAVIDLANKLRLD